MKRQYDARRRAEVRVCAVEGCEKRASGPLTYCGAHHGRRSRTGSFGETASRTNDGNPRNYETAHTHVRAKRGRASSYACVDCGHTAADWSLRHSAQIRLTQSSGERAGLAFSPNLGDYEPRCKPCHATYDREASHGRRLGHGTQVPA